MSKGPYKTILIAICLAFTSPSLLAKDKGNSDKHYKKHHGHNNDLPPGLQKQQARGRGLPPGWQKKLAAGEVINEDIYAYAKPVSHRESVRLHILPGEEIVHVENKLVRLIKATRTIVEVLDE